jgi:soluble lytic murein transglycosylase-like protein
MIHYAVSAVLLVTAGSLARGDSKTDVSHVQPATRGGSSDIQLLDLSSVRRMFNDLARDRTSTAEGERAAAWSDFSLLVEAVVGAPVGTLAFDELAQATTTARGPHVLAAPGVSARDTTAYQLLGIGYSARETADVVSGRISKKALDTARKMLLVGLGREAAADYLDSQYKRAMAVLKPPGARSDGRPSAMSAFDVAIQRHASTHGVDPDIVRAVIVVESNFDPAARSRAGAIGLMQLMPATARALGVDPSMPEQNIEGGVRYLSELLRMFGGIELALIAYNGGPGFARRYARGEIALYGETRDYVKRVLARLGAPH